MKIGEYDITTTLKKDAVYQWVEALDRDRGRKFVLQILTANLSSEAIATFTSYFDKLQAVRRKGIFGPTQMFSTAEYPLVLVYSYIGTIPLQVTLEQTPSKAIEWWYQASERLHVIHNKNIVHGGISLDSFVIAADEHLYLTNFGAAPALELGLEASPEYQKILAPEVLEQQLVTPVGDIYAFAKTVVAWRSDLTTSEWYRRAIDINPERRFQRIRQLFENLKKELDTDLEGNDTRESPVSQTGIIPKYILEVKVEPPEAGNIIGGGSYPAAENVSVVAIASSGWKFEAWSGSLMGTGNPMTVTMDDNKSAIALFSKVAEPPSDVSEEVKILKERVFILEKQLEEVPKLKERVSNLEKQLQDVYRKRWQMENRPYPGQEIIEAALKQDREEREKDEDEFKVYREEFELLQKWGSDLQESIESAVKDCQQKLFEYQQTTANLTVNLTPEFQKKLQQKHQALELIGKMLGKLPELSNLLVKDESPPEELPKIAEAELMNIVKEANTEKDAELAIQQKLERVGDRRWQLVCESRKLAEGYRKGWLNFFEKKVLPILDGIDDWEKYSRELKTECPKERNILESLLQLHDELRQIVLKMLKSANIRSMKVETEEPIDYNRHEPFDAQPHDTWENEVIIEVTRQGYEYQPEGSQEWLVLRSAQVVVVKNY